MPSSSTTSSSAQPSRVAEREAGRIVPIGNRVIERHEIARGTRRTDLLAHARHDRTLAIHLHAEHRGMPVQHGAGEETRVGRRVGDVRDRLAGAFEQRADEADAAGCANGWNEARRIDVETPVGAIDLSKRLARLARSERIGIGVRFAQILRQRSRIVQPFAHAKVLVVRGLVREKRARIGGLGMRITRAEMVNFQPVRFRDGAQVRQRCGHLPRHRNRLTSDVGSRQCRARSLGHARGRRDLRIRHTALGCRFRQEPSTTQLEHRCNNCTSKRTAASARICCWCTAF